MTRLARLLHALRLGRRGAGARHRASPSRRCRSTAASSCCATRRPARRSASWRASKDRIELRPKSEVPVSQTMVEQVMSERVALLTYDAQSDQRLAGGESIRIHQIRAAMCAPLWSGEKIIGVLQVDTPFHAGTFNEQDLDLLTALANYAAVAVERLRYAERGRVRAPGAQPARALPLAGGDRGDRARRARRRGRRCAGCAAAEATVLFADLVGFTALSEKRSPRGGRRDARGLLHARGGGDLRRRRHARQVHRRLRHGVLRRAGARRPTTRSGRCGRRSRSRRRRTSWNAERARRGLPTLVVRIAINSGPVVVGDVGSKRRVDYTVLGNTVNVARAARRLRRRGGRDHDRRRDPAPARRRLPDRAARRVPAQGPRAAGASAYPRAAGEPRA